MAALREIKLGRCKAARSFYILVGALLLRFVSGFDPAHPALPPGRLHEWSLF